jgi:hypothetical protein
MNLILVSFDKEINIYRGDQNPLKKTGRILKSLMSRK